MKINVIANNLDSKETYKFNISYLNEEEIIFISLNELKLKICNDNSDDKISIIPNKIFLNLQENYIKINFTKNNFIEWITKEYDII